MQNIIFGLETMVIGFSVVMATLYFLYLILCAFSLCFVKSENSGPKKKDKGLPTVSLDEVGVAPVAAAVCQQSPGTSEIVAAITAAVAVCLGKPASQLRILSVEPVHSAQTARDWTVFGRKRLMESRQDLAMLRRERRK